MRADVPGALDHASGDVDEFDAALVRGAGGVPAVPGVLPEAVEPVELRDGDGPGLQEKETELGLAPAGGGRGSRGGGEVAVGDTDGAGAAPVPARPSGWIARAAAFLRASWAELQRVQWPDRRQVSQATAVVLGFVAIAGAYLGAADWLAQKIVNLIL
jgi:preprotein translocase subunit SecE